MESYNLWPFAPGFFTWQRIFKVCSRAYVFQHEPVLSDDCMRLHFELCHTLFPRSSIGGHLGGCVLWLFWKMLLWMFVYKFLCGPSFSVLLGINLGVEITGWKNNSVRNILRSCLFSRVAVPLSIPTIDCPRVPRFPHPPQHLLLTIFFISAALLDAKRLFIS